MKKSLFTRLCFLLGLVSLTTQAQIISVTPGTDFNVVPGTIVSMENLQLTPSANFTLSGVALDKTTTTTNISVIPTIAKYYKFSGTTNAYSGEVLFTYLDAELNSFTESSLKLLYHNGTAWFFDDNGTNSPSANAVTSNLSGIPLNELSLGTGTLQTYYVDADGDGFGSTVAVQGIAPTPPPGYSVNNTDCNDADNTVNASTTTTTVVTACGTYTWAVNGQAYTTGGTYTDVVTSCHTEVLTLTINPIPAQPTIACWQTATFNSTTCAWVVTGTAPPTPSVTISADTSIICAGSPVVFTAVATNGGTSPTFQWKVNGNSVQNSSSANYTSSNLTSTDVVTVALTSNDGFVLSNGFAIIGLQKWSASNLNVSTYSNGEPIPQITSASEWESTTQGAWCYYNNDPTKDKLYNGYAVTDARGLAPLGSHVPTQAEWQQLVTTLGGTTAASLALRATSGWSNNGNGTNSSHFSALPGGLMFSNSGFIQEENGFWWNATEDTQGSLGHSQMNAGQPYIEYDHFNVKNLGMNVRYVSDTAPCVSSQTVVSSGLTITVTATTVYYQDLDGDGYGNASASQLACAPPTGYVTNNTDCAPTDETKWRTGNFYTDADNDGYNNGAPQSSVCYGATTPSGYTVSNIGTDCLDSNFEVNPNHVEVLGNSIDDNCDGVVDEVAPTSSLQPNQCGITLINLSQTIYANVIYPTAQGYRFEITEVANPTNVRTYDSEYNRFSLSNLSGGATYATTYSIRVAVKTAPGFWRAYAAACTVTTPAVAATTKVHASQCGITLTSIEATLYCDAVPNATGYRFRITDGVTTQTYSTSVNRFSLTSSPLTANFGTTYAVDVQLRFGSTWETTWGTVCNITTPATPGTSNVSAAQCGINITNLWATIYATQVAVATGYRFEVTKGAQTVFYDTSNSRFSLRNITVPGFTTSNASYSIRVSIKFNNIYRAFGTACTITTNGASRVTTTPVEVFEVKAYPNPFAANFKLEINTSSESNVGVKVYDMIGRLIETHQSDVPQMTTLEIGNLYPTGVYTIIVTQGDNSKTVRVIKR